MAQHHKNINFWCQPVVFQTEMKGKSTIKIARRVNLSKEAKGGSGGGGGRGGRGANLQKGGNPNNSHHVAKKKSYMHKNREIRSNLLKKYKK